MAEPRTHILIRRLCETIYPPLPWIGNFASRLLLGLLTSFVAFASAATAKASDTAVSLKLSSSTISLGTVETMTAAVTYYGYPIAPGVVTFRDGQTVLGTAQLVATQGASTYGSAALRTRFAIGTHSISASYAGADGFQSSSSAAQTLTVTGVHPTSTSVTETGYVGSYALQSTVVGNGSLVSPTGSVSFFDTNHGNSLLAEGVLSAATVNLSFFNNTDLTLADQTAGKLITADFNGDGIPDLATIVQSAPYTIEVFLGNGDGTFNLKSTVVVQLGDGDGDLAVGDMNNDGTPDLIYTSRVLSSSNPVLSTVSVLLGNGDGTFTAVSQTAPGASAALGGITIADFNNDGNLDAACASSDTGRVTVLLGNGDGTFTPSSQSNLYATQSEALVAGDFNGDGNMDLAVASINNNVVILLGNGHGSFTEGPQTPATGNFPWYIIATDFNNDGILDLATANEQDGTVTVLLGNGNGTFNAVADIPSIGYDPVGLAVADFNQDGIPDLAVSDGQYNTVILLGEGDGAFTRNPQMATAGIGPGELASADFNGDGVPDLATSLSISPYIDIFLTQLTETATVTVIDVAPPGPGTHLVDAMYSGDSNYAFSVSGTVSLKGEPLIRTTLTLSAKPTSSAFGKQVTLTAKVSPEDAQGHSVDGSPITFYNGSTVLGGGVLNFGVASLKVSSLPVGVDKLKATYPGDPYFEAAAGKLEFVVSKAEQKITWPHIGTQVKGTNLTLRATGGGSMNPIIFTSSTPHVCTIQPAQANSNAIARLVATGTCAITAKQAGNADYFAATPVEQSFTVRK